MLGTLRPSGSLLNNGSLSGFRLASLPRCSLLCRLAHWTRSSRLSRLALAQRGSL